MLYSRTITFSIREPLNIGGRLFLSVFFGICMLTVYYGTINQSKILVINQVELQNTTGALFLLIMMLMLVQAFCNVLVF